MCIDPEVGRRLAEHYKNKGETENYKLQVESNHYQSLIIARQRISSRYTQEPIDAISKNHRYTISTESKICILIVCSIAGLFLRSYLRK